MSDQEVEAVLRRLDEVHRLECDGVALEVWRDFDTDETRLRVPGTAVLRVDEDKLYDYFSERGVAVTDESVARVLCGIYKKPAHYQQLIVWKKLK